MRLLNNSLYIEDIDKVANANIPWGKLKNKSIMVTGATGMIGSFLIDVIMYKNKTAELNCSVYAVTRNVENAKKRFDEYQDTKNLFYYKADVNKELSFANRISFDYILHLASNTHPLQYAKEPISTITTNLLGLKNILDFASVDGKSRILFTSSVEVYGQNRGDVERFDEEYLGYINCNTLRAGYPESKRCSEALCQAYICERNMDVVIARLSRVYGPTLLKDDTKALSQFIRNAVDCENIVLKSSGEQEYSYLYVADAVSGILFVLLNGRTGEAYNISDIESDISLRELANMLSRKANTKVVYGNPNSTEKAGYSTATKAKLDPSKLGRMGWTANYTLDCGLDRTVKILRLLDNN